MQSMPEPLQVVELLGEAAEVAGTVVIAVEVPTHVDLVEDRRLEPERVPLEPVAGLGHAGATTFSTWLWPGPSAT